MAATSTRDLVVDLDEVRNSQLPVAVVSGGLSWRSANEVSKVWLLLTQTSPHGDEIIRVCDLHADKEGWIKAAAGKSMLHGLDRRAPLLAVAGDMTGRVAKKALALVLFHTGLSAILGSVPLAIAINVLDIGPVPWWRARGRSQT